MDYQQQHIRTGYDFAVMQARQDANRGRDASYWSGQSSALAIWANAAPAWEFQGHVNERIYLRFDYAPRHAK